MNQGSRILTIVVGMVILASQPAWGQSGRLELNLDHLAKNAAESVTVTLDKWMLKFAAGVIPEGDDEDEEIKRLVNGLEGVYVRVFKFDKEGAYSPAEVDALRKQLRAPGWVPIVKVDNKKGGETVDICLRREGEKVRGLAIVVAEPKELVVVNIVGDIDLERLSKLEGQLGIPRMNLEMKARKSTREEPATQ